MLPINTYLLYELPLKTAFNKKKLHSFQIKIFKWNFWKRKKSIIQILTTQLSVYDGGPNPELFLSSLLYTVVL